MADVNACEAVRALPLPIGSRVQVTRLRMDALRTAARMTLYRMPAPAIGAGPAFIPAAVPRPRHPGGARRRRSLRVLPGR